MNTRSHPLDLLSRLSPALQLIATTAASWNLIAPVRPRKRVRRIALHSLARVRSGAVAGRDPAPAENPRNRHKA